MAKRNKDSEDQNDNLNENTGGEDSFGLPEIEYKPLDQAEETPAPAAETTEKSSYSYQPEKSEYSSYAAESEESKAPVVIGLVIGLVVIVSGYLIYEFVYKPQAEKERKELAAIEAAKKKKAEEARLAKERADEEERKRREAEAAATVQAATGEIVTLTDKTGRYYVVVASAVDGDLVMDYAKKLSDKGTGTKIIPPFGKWKYYRIAISDHDTFANAQAAADQSKPTYGEATWVIRF